MARHSNTTTAQRKAFGVALEVAMAAAQIRSTAELHRRGNEAGIDKTAGSFVTWTRGGSEPSRPEVLILEEICNVEPGTLSRHLGWIPLGVSTDVTIEEAIMADLRITDANKAVLLALITQLRN
tara:strand:- start:161 stop:532 length:372 start_codon:yes stop_codon:yes gene_type:complete